ncbi:MAG: hypothetical protein HKN13_15255 [Rhodothermales bacterium]|nr:hypothetical protein [Rhodothermales bacterium]
MALSAAKQAVVDAYNEATARTKEHFRHVPSLIEQYKPEVAVGYVFDCASAAHNATIVAGLVTKHKAHRAVAREVAVFQECAWDEFHYEYQTVFGSVIPEAVSILFGEANELRRALLSGKRVSSKDQCGLIIQMLQYADALDEFVYADARIHPFADLSSAKPRGSSLDKSSTRWVLKGMGFPIL